MIAQKNDFGTFKGVFVPSILTILGVILFLRLGWVVGNAGLTMTFAIITFSSLITLITGLSISSTATNTEVGPGGSYFLISRCFGLEPGAAIGLPLYLAQALGISFYVVGFAESLQIFFPELPVTSVAFVTLIILTAVTFFSSSLALKMQIFILVAIILSILSFWFGSPYTPEPSLDFDISKVGANFGFWGIFAVFFPAVTGIEAGISMSGDLKDPRKSLPTGTLAAVIVGYLVYMLSALILYNLSSVEPLILDSLIMTKIAIVPIIIYIGLWGATLSSTMGALLGAPRTMQALAKDKILPAFLAVGTEDTNDPRAATVVSFLIAGAGILLGDLNAIAEILSMFFLTSYGALNFAAGLEGLIDNPSWRPTFRISWAISLLGGFLCFGAMFMINSGASFIAIGAVILIYYLMRLRDVKSNYTDIRTGLTNHFSRKFIYQLNSLTTDARNWRPHFLILSGSPKSRFHLIDLAYTISHKRGFMTVASIIKSDKLDFQKKSDLEKSTKEFLSKNKIEALTKITRANSISEGAQNLLENYGIGPVTPNTIVIGDTANDENIHEHVKIIQSSYLRHVNTIIVKDKVEVTADTIKKGGREIDVWWRGINGNVSLMLTLAYMLKTSSKWRNAKLTLKSIATNREEQEGIEKALSDFLTSSRVPAKYEVFLKPEDTNAYSIISESSKNSDIVFMGLKEPDENLPLYSDYYKQIMTNTDNLKTVFYVLESEKISFVDIFQ